MRTAVTAFNQFDSLLYESNQNCFCGFLLIHNREIKKKSKVIPRTGHKGPEGA
jgi:hypothetical protein